MAIKTSEKIKTICKVILEPKILSALISQREFGYLHDIGWFESFKIKKAVDKNGNTIPWFTYSFIDFIENRLNSSLTVFEFGSGSSTIYFSKKVADIWSVEHNKEWYDIVARSKNKNTRIILTDSDSESDYLAPLNNFSDKASIIIVDGLHRNSCLRHSINKITNDGVIILDDSERNDYRSGIEYLESSGFKRLDFWGIAPTILFKKCTTLFYKSQNCLNV